MMLTNKEILEASQQYIRAVFADRLREEGFVSPNSCDFMWYRVVNQEVINSIFFYTGSRYEPISLRMGYGVHPLFITPYVPKDVYTRNPPYNLVIFSDEVILSEERPNIGERGHAIFYAGDYWVDMPMGKDKGLYTFDGIILPQMENTRTQRACFDLHKELVLSEPVIYPKDMLITLDRKLNRASGDYFDEAIFFNDQELFPDYYKKAKERLDRILADPKRKKTKQQKEDLERRRQQVEVFAGGPREPYLEVLAQRRLKNIALLQKMGVPIA